MKKIVYGKKLFAVEENVHRGYESCTRAFIRQNEKFKENEVPVACVFEYTEAAEPMEDTIADKLLCRQIIEIAKAHLDSDDYMIFQKNILHGQDEQKCAELLGVSQQAVSKRKLKIIEKLKVLIKV